MHFRQKTVRRFQIPIDERSTDEYRLLVADLGLPPSLDLTSPVLSAPTARMSIRLKVFPATLHYLFSGQMVLGMCPGGFGRCLSLARVAYCCQPPPSALYS